MLEADVGSAMLRGDGETQRQMRFADQAAERLSATCPLGDFFANGRLVGRPSHFRSGSRPNNLPHDPGGSRTRDLRIKRANSPLMPGVVEHRQDMLRASFGEVRLIVGHR